MIAAWWLVGLAFGGSVRVVRAGETVESIAAGYGDLALVEEIRRRNKLGTDRQPAVGTVLDLPDRLSDGDCQASYVQAHGGTGTVRIPGEREPRPVRDLDPLPVGATVCTGADGFARIHLAVTFDTDSHDAIVLLPGTCVTIRSSHVVGGKRASLVDLGGGSVRVEEMGDGQVVVRTGDGIAVGDRGGFRVVQEAATTRTEAVAGDVVTVAAGSEVELPKGFGNRIPRGQAPGAPVALPGIPTPELPVDGAALRVPDFVWGPVDGAFGYAIEIAPTPGFDVPVWRSLSGKPAWLPSVLLLPVEDGGLWWRVTAVDGLGFEGAPSLPRRFLVPDWAL